MRYTLAMLLALGMAASVVVPAAFAQEHEGPDAPATAVTTQTQPTDPGTIAGPMGPAQNENADKGHDRN